MFDVKRSMFNVQVFKYAGSYPTTTRPPHPQAKSGHRASREIKNELGQFLNGDFASTQTLGSVGFYRGKHVEFDWQTSLNELGVIVAAPT